MATSIKSLHQRMLAGMGSDDLATLVAYISDARSDTTLRFDNLGDNFGEQALNLLLYCRDRRCLSLLIQNLKECYPVALATTPPHPDPAWEVWAQQVDAARVNTDALPSPNTGVVAAESLAALDPMPGSPATIIVPPVADPPASPVEAATLPRPLPWVWLVGGGVTVILLAAILLLRAPDNPSANLAVVQPTATVSKPTLAQIPAATLTPVVTFDPASCVIQPILGFGRIYSGQPGVAGRLGCATGGEESANGVYHEFQRGYMVWVQDTRLIHIFLKGSELRYSIYPDTYVDGTPEPRSDVVLGEGLYLPKRGFGRVWREQQLASIIGYAVTENETRLLPVAHQEFKQGRMLFISTDPTNIFVLYGPPDGNNGSWQRFLNGIPDSGL